MEIRDEAKRRAIAEAVWVVVAEGGIGAVTVRSVAAAAGVSPGRVQHYFPTKEALVRASAERMIDAAAQAHDGAGAPPRERLTVILAHALARAADRSAGTGVFYSFVSAGVADPAVADILAEAKRGAVAEITLLVAELAPGHADPAGAARRLLALSDGLTLQVFLGALPVAEARATLDRAVSRELA